MAWSVHGRVTSKRIKGFCAAEPAQKASWADAGERRVGLQGLWKFQFAGGDDLTMGQAL